MNQSEIIRGDKFIPVFQGDDTVIIGVSKYWRWEKYVHLSGNASEMKSFHFLILLVRPVLDGKLSLGTRAGCS